VARFWWCSRGARRSSAILAALEGGPLLAQIERNVRPLAAALDVMISLVASLAPPGRPDLRS
jgi:hypothetical protein